MRMMGELWGWWVNNGWIWGWWINYEDDGWVIKIMSDKNDEWVMRVMGEL
jgi:hypothetical protein